MRRSFYHLTRDDREVILEGIVNATPLSDIAATLGKDPTSISREVKAHRSFDGRHTVRRTNICVYAAECSRTGLCGAAQCRRLCSHCLSRHCFDICCDFVEKKCPRTERWPYVCNGCGQKGRCGLARYRYHEPPRVDWRVLHLVKQS